MLLARQANADTDKELKKSRIQIKNEEKIFAAATSVFARYGYHGATVDLIAKKAGMSKPNLLYYFSSKKALYIEVLHQIYNIWLEPLRELDVSKDPEEELSRYIDLKIEHSRLYPLASKIWANEIIAGAPLLKPVLENDLRETVKKKSKVLRTWMRQGKINKFDAEHFLFMIWTTTQHYADFSTQIETVTDKTLDDDRFFKQTKKNVKQILLRGILRP